MAHKINPIRKIDLLEMSFLTRGGSFLSYGGKNMKGVSLIELMIVVAIIGILISFTAVASDWFMRETRLTENRDRLVADLEFVKLKSVTEYPFAIFLDNDNYEMRILNDGRCSTTTTTDCYQNNNCLSGETCIPGNSIRDAGERTTLADPAIDSDSASRFRGIVPSVIFQTGYKMTWTNCEGDDELWFDRKGMPRCGNASIWRTGSGIITLWHDTDGDDVLDADELARTISIGNAGRIQYE